jgi:hypothetical protein
VDESFLTSPPLCPGADRLDVAACWSCWFAGAWMDPSELFLLSDWLLERVLPWLSLRARGSLLLAG